MKFVISFRVSFSLDLNVSTLPLLAPSGYQLQLGLSLIKVPLPAIWLRPKFAAPSPSLVSPCRWSND